VGGFVHSIVPAGPQRHNNYPGQRDACNAGQCDAREPNVAGFWLLRELSRVAGDAGAHARCVESPM